MYEISVKCKIHLKETIKKDEWARFLDSAPWFR